MNNREIILEMALLYFANFGYEATGTQDICDAAGVTKPTMYHYFKSKRGLIEAILTENFTPFLARLKEASSYQHDLTLSLEKVMRVYFHFASLNPTFYRLQLSMRYAPVKTESHEVITPWVKQQAELIQGLFEAAESDHGNMLGRAHGYYLTFLAMINSYILEAMDKGQVFNDELLYQARHQFMHGIFS